MWQRLDHSRPLRLSRLLQPSQNCFLCCSSSCGLGSRGAASPVALHLGPARCGEGEAEARLPEARLCSPSPHLPALRGCCPAPAQSCWPGAVEQQEALATFWPLPSQHRAAAPGSVCRYLPPPATAAWWALPYPKGPGPARAAWSICLPVLCLARDLAPSRAAAGLPASSQGGR